MSYEEAGESESPFDMNLDTPIPGVADEFRRLLLDCKHAIYMAIVLSPDEETDEAHRDSLTQDFLYNLQHLENQIFSIQRNGNLANARWIDFPEQAQPKIQKLFEQFETICRENESSPVDMIPYQDYIHTSLHTFPYVQNDNFSD